MALHTSTQPCESTGLLQTIADDGINNAAAVVEGPRLPARTRRALVGAFVITALSTLSRIVSASSMLDLISSISCAEYYSLHAPSHSADCSIDAVSTRFANTMAYVGSLNSTSSCFCSIFVAPYLIRKLGHKYSMLIGTSAFVLERSLYVWLSHAAQPKQPGGRTSIEARTALHIFVMQAGVFGILGVPETLLDMVTQAIVLETVPMELRSTWLARLQSCASIGALVATTIMHSLDLDTGSDLITDTTPIQFAAGISLLTALVSFLPFHFKTGISPARPHIRTAVQAEHTSVNNGKIAKLWTTVVQALRPLQLIFQPIRRGDLRQKDWRLSRVLIASFLYGEIAVAGNLVLFYSRTRFHTRAKETNLMIGFLNFATWIWLGYGFAHAAKWVRRRSRRTLASQSTLTRYEAVEERRGTENPEQEEIVEAGFSLAEDCLLTLFSLSMDVLAWGIFAFAGHVGNFPFFLSGVLALSLSAGGGSSFTSLSTSLLPDGTSTDELLAALFFSGNISSAVAPMLSTRIYGTGLEINFPELIFVFTAALSCVSFALVASVKTRALPSRLM